MKPRFLLAGALALAAAAANAADSAALPTQPLAPRAQSKAAPQPFAHKLVPPTMSVTTVTRRADGTLEMNCAQKPNPRARIPAQAAQP